MADVKLLQPNEAGYAAQQADFAAKGLDAKGQPKTGDTTNTGAPRNITGATKASKRASLQGTFLRVYRKPTTGQQVAVYGVAGTAADLAAFKASQGVNYKVDNESGVPLYFVAILPGRRLQQRMKLIQTVSYDNAQPNVPIPGRFVVDESASLFEDTNKFADMVMAEEAKIIAARRLLGQNSGGANPNSALRTTTQMQDEDIVLEEEESIV